MHTATQERSPYAEPGIKRITNHIHHRTEEERIQDAVADEFNIPRTIFMEYILQNTRKEEVVRPRQITQALIKHTTRRTLAQIGNQYGTKDHATILHSCRTLQNEYDTNRGYRTMIKRILDNAELPRIISLLDGGC